MKVTRLFLTKLEAAHNHVSVFDFLDALILSVGAGGDHWTFGTHCSYRCMICVPKAAPPSQRMKAVLSRMRVAGVTRYAPRLLRAFVARQSKQLLISMYERLSLNR